MVAIFISSAASDDQIAELIGADLIEHGCSVVTPTPAELRASPESWTNLLFASDFALLLYGNQGLTASQHLQLQMLSEAMGTDRSGPRLVPILLPGAKRPPRSETPYAIASVPWIDASTVSDPASIVRIVSESLVGIEARQASMSPESATGNPYRGLAAFDERHTEDFYGREGLVESLTSELIRASEREGVTSRLLAIVGPSGNGKSSLVKAGILPRLRTAFAGMGLSMQIIVIRPGSEPIEALAIALTRLHEAGRLLSPRAYIEQLTEDNLTLHFAGNLLDSQDRLVVVVDQFEEVFTLTAKETARDSLIANLLNAATHPDGKTTVILTLRSDFYGHCAAYPQLAFQLSSAQALIAAMNDSELRRAIEMPALRRNVHFEPGLVDRLVTEIRGEPGALPLLQFALMELWSQCAPNMITHSAYDAIGGVGGALAQRAGAIYQDLPLAEQTLFRRLMLRLVQPGDRTDDTRRRVRTAELEFRDTSASDVRRMIELLASPQYRLIVVTLESGEQTIEITHEALLTRWPLLRQWVDAERESLLYGRALTFAAEEWESGHDEAYLMRGASLARALQWDAAHPDILNVDEEKYLVASIAKELELNLAGPSESLSVQLSQCRAMGNRLAEAISLTRATAQGATVLRRLTLIRGVQTLDEAGQLIDSLLSVDHIEFQLITDILRNFGDAELGGEIFSRMEQTPDQNARLRLMLAAAQVSPQDDRWRFLAPALAKSLSFMTPTWLNQWVPIADPIADRLHEPLLNLIISTPNADDSSRANAFYAFLHLTPIDPKMLASLIAFVDDDMFGSVTKLMADINAYGNPDLLKQRLASIARSGVGGVDGTRRLAGTLTVAGALGDWEPLWHTLEEPAPYEVMYEVARQLWKRDVSFHHLVEALDMATDPTQQACLMLALQQTQQTPSIEISQAIIEIFSNNSSSLVHASAGLLLSKWLGDEQRLALEYELATVLPDERGRQWWVTTTTGIPLTFNWIEAGTFRMGSPRHEAGRSTVERQRLVRISKPFLLADRVITRGEYEPLVQKWGRLPFLENIDEWSPTMGHPIVSQTWEEAREFCTDLTRDAEITGYIFSLPSEAQWEYACRAGTATAYCFGDDPAKLGLFAWYLANCSDRQTRPPRLLWPNPAGLFDVHGGVYEWCYDFYGPYEGESVRDPTGPPNGPGRVLRGGGYNYSAQDCRSAYRYFTQASNRNARIGMRILCTADKRNPLLRDQS